MNKDFSTTKPQKMGYKNHLIPASIILFITVGYVFTKKKKISVGYVRQTSPTWFAMGLKATSVTKIYKPIHLKIITKWSR